MSASLHNSLLSDFSQSAYCIKQPCLLSHTLAKIDKNNFGKQYNANTTEKNTNLFPRICQDCLLIKFGLYESMHSETMNYMNCIINETQGIDLVNKTEGPYLRAFKATNNTVHDKHIVFPKNCIILPCGKLLVDILMSDTNILFEMNAKVPEIVITKVNGHKTIEGDYGKFRRDKEKSIDLDFEESKTQLLKEMKDKYEQILINEENNKLMEIEYNDTEIDNFFEAQLTKNIEDAKNYIEKNFQDKYNNVSKAYDEEIEKKGTKTTGDQILNNLQQQMKQLIKDKATRLKQHIKTLTEETENVKKNRKESKLYEVNLKYDEKLKNLRLNVDKQIKQESEKINALFEDKKQKKLLIYKYSKKIIPTSMEIYSLNPYIYSYFKHLHDWMTTLKSNKKKIDYQSLEEIICNKNFSDNESLSAAFEVDLLLIGNLINPIAATSYYVTNAKNIIMRQDKSVYALNIHFNEKKQMLEEANTKINFYGDIEFVQPDKSSQIELSNFQCLDKEKIQHLNSLLFSYVLGTRQLIVERQQGLVDYFIKKNDDGDNICSASGLHVSSFCVPHVVKKNNDVFRQYYSNVRWIEGVGLVSTTKICQNELLIIDEQIDLETFIRAKISNYDQSLVYSIPDMDAQVSSNVIYEFESRKHHRPKMCLYTNL